MIQKKPCPASNRPKIRSTVTENAFENIKLACMTFMDCKFDQYDVPIWSRHGSEASLHNYRVPVLIAGAPAVSPHESLLQSEIYINSLGIDQKVSNRDNIEQIAELSSLVIN